jgi:kynurenine formamidase
LPVRAGIRNAWGVYGADDRLGCLNELTADRVLDAKSAIRTGAVFPLNLDMRLPEPPLFERSSLRHELIRSRSGIGLNDLVTDWNTQGSSQWDGFLHIAWPGHGHYNAGRSHGMDVWARRGIAGRAVLADVGRWRESAGRPLHFDRPDPITAMDIAATLQEQRTSVRPGDILLIRTGWLDWYARTDQETRVRLSGPGTIVAPGLSAAEATAAYLWDHRFAAVASDNPALETMPACHESPEGAADPGDWVKAAEVWLHGRLLPALGMPIGELWDLSALARHCAQTREYDGFLASAPINLAGAAASPANALVIT